jgi:hypothetical protein
LLKTRGEAHITVVTPVEYWHVLRKVGVTIAEINLIAQESQIQRAQFRVICLGKRSKELAGIKESTYYVVVRSPDLLQIRRKVRDLYLSKRGSRRAFKPENWLPHITLGYTERDLHESDGVKKDENSCILPIQLL